MIKKVGRLHWIGYLNRDDEFVATAGPFTTLQAAIDAYGRD